MLPVRTRTIPVLAALALAACQEAPVGPQAALFGARASMTDGETVEVADAALPHLVHFKPGRGDAVRMAASAVGGTVESLNDRFGFAVVTGLDGESDLAALRGVNGVLDVALDEVVSMDLPTTVETADADLESPTAPNTAAFYARQWHMQVVDAASAWSAGKLGSSSVTVAVIDGGVDWTHPDLAGRVDLARSVSFLPIETSVVNTLYPGAHPVADLQYHGTHVAATIASNGIVGAGVTSQTTIVGIKACYGVNITSGGVLVARAGSCSGAAILSGLAHAIETGADVVNMSLGGAFLKRGSKGYVSTLNRVFNAASQAGITVVVAAGNNGSDLDRHQLPDADGNPVDYPSLFKTYCDAPHVLCVSATGPTAGDLNGPWTNIDALAGYSNYGRSVISVAAPGGNFRPVWAACSKFSRAVPQCRTGNFILGISGTSMATPHVAGLAALLNAEGITQPSQVRARIRQGAVDLGEPGHDAQYGAGRISVRGSLGL